MDAKQKWKHMYRLLRMARRECSKATIDLVTFGTGVVLVASDGEVKHQPFADLSTVKAMSVERLLDGGVITITNESEAKHRPMKSMFDFSYQDEVDIREAFRVPAELLTSGSYERV
jgi:hypothetical protein